VFPRPRYAVCVIAVSLARDCVVFPKIKPFTFGDTPVFAGQSAQVTCSVLEGDSPLELSWTFDGPRDVFEMGASALSVGTKTTLLSIDNTNSDHRGNYTCHVANRAGNASYTASLNVHGILTYVYIYIQLFGIWNCHVLFCHELVRARTYVDENVYRVESAIRTFCLVNRRDS